MVRPLPAAVPESRIRPLYFPSCEPVHSLWDVGPVCPGFLSQQPGVLADSQVSEHSLCAPLPEVGPGATAGEDAEAQKAPRSHAREWGIQGLCVTPPNTHLISHQARPPSGS